MKFLAFETATSACSAALLIHGEIKELFEIAPQRHAELILPMIEQLLLEAGIKLSQLDAICIGQGPGSFMGVRIAAGIAQGLAFGANLPVITLSTLQILAQSAYQQTERPEVIAAWDARMNAVYWGIYRLNHQGIMVSLKADALNEPRELIIPPQHRWLLAGNAWEIYRHELKEMLGYWDELTGIYPRAAAMIALAKVAYDEGKVRNPLQIEPVYLRNDVAHTHKKISGGCDEK
jgi:tRNA threonylcarbamoyladenosine biosynthesis protein TsaB